MKHSSQWCRNNCINPGSVPSPSLDKGKQKKVRFDKLLKKNSSKGLNAPFRFDILAQLANIPARITLYELLRLSKETREALRDALADSETFLTQVPTIPSDDDRNPYPQCHLVQRQVSSITFTPEDMLLKDNTHDRSHAPLPKIWSTVRDDGQQILMKRKRERLGCFNVVWVGMRMVELFPI